MIHDSPVLTVVIFCNNNYAVTEVVAPTDPQIVEHGLTEGYTLPLYQTE